MDVPREILLNFHGEGSLENKEASEDREIASKTKPRSDRALEPPRRLPRAGVRSDVEAISASHVAIRSCVRWPLHRLSICEAGLYVAFFHSVVVVNAAVFFRYRVR